MPQNGGRMDKRGNLENRIPLLKLSCAQYIGSKSIIVANGT